mmetsp:Transcript_51478/g.119659  ORF Transcript_51478/g.119659 Transcript_51478/m.119659 type:complete len:462 (-) Transcript_51478:119-1504(-)
MKDLAHTRSAVEQLECRLEACERYVAELRETQAACDTARQPALEGLHGLARRLGTVGSERCWRFEAAVEARLSSPEGRMDSPCRRLSDSSRSAGSPRQHRKSAAACADLAACDDACSGPQRSHSEKGETQADEPMNCVWHTAACQAPGSPCFRSHWWLQEFTGTFADERAADSKHLHSIRADVLPCSLARRFNNLHEELRQPASTVAATEGILQQLVGRVVACEMHGAALDGEFHQASRSKAAAEAFCETLRERVDGLDARVATVTERLEAALEKVEQLEQGLMQEHEDRQECEQRITLLWRDLQAELALDHQARAAHKRWVEEQVAQDRLVRERQHDRLQEVLDREADAREHRFEGCEEVGKHCKVISELVHALQRSLSVCNSMIHEENEARCKEVKSLWEAIRSVSHEAHPVCLDNKVSQEEAEVTDSYVPFPCQPLTSFLRLGNSRLPQQLAPLDAAH